MRNALILLLIIAVIVVGFFFFKNTREDTTLPPTATGKTIQIPLLERGTSSQRGMATLTDMNDTLKVTLTLTGGTVGVAEPAHIHSGSCESLGSPRYTLTEISGGNSVTELTGVTVDQLLDTMPLAINVHKSNAEAGVSVSCGDILPLGSKPTTNVTISATTTASTTTTVHSTTTQPARTTEVIQSGGATTTTY